MDNRRRPRLVENATNQCDTLALIQDNATLSAEARDCESCGQPLGMRSGPLGNWDAFPAGVKFDPSDEELLLHLRAEVGRGDTKSHPFINNFISVLDGEDGICQTHPENLPGVKKDGSSKHFFHRPAKAYTTGTRKRRKIHSEDEEPGVETRWHKTGKTRSVHENGQQILGWKKIMVLYRNAGSKKSKPEKTNWILHQYHLGQTEEETDGELVVCKVFYQKQPRQCTGGKPAEGVTEETMDLNQGSRDNSICRSSVSRGTPVTPKVDTPQRPRSMRPDALGKIGGAPTQSSKESDLTVIGMDMQAAAASELTSNPVLSKHEVAMPGSRTGNFANGGQENSTPLTQHQTLHEDYHTEWTEEVSTSGKSCQNESDNQVGAQCPLLSSEQGEPQFVPSYGVESQPQYQEEENIFSLLCDEDLRVDSLLNMDFNFHFGSLEEPFVSNPNEDYPAVDDILEDTPPELNMDYILSSQEALDVISLKPGCGSLDNDDSLSST